jgi:LmbE family N-acetylglucosaminyl deacetylase
MLKLALADCSNLLFIGAHCDDIEIGCGGTILKILQLNPDVNITWVVLSSNDLRKNEVENSARMFCANKELNLQIKNFRNSYFPYIGAEIKEFFEELKLTLNPDCIFTHYKKDLHQDHRVISELTWNTFRDHLILEYEIPKYDGGLGSPNVFIELNEKDLNNKVKILMNSFTSQLGKSWFSENTFQALARLRGIECNANSQYAEAYYGNKIVIDI